MAWGEGRDHFSSPGESLQLPRGVLWSIWGSKVHHLGEDRSRIKKGPGHERGPGWRGRVSRMERRGPDWRGRVQDGGGGVQDGGLGSRMEGEGSGMEGAESWVE